MQQVKRLLSVAFIFAACGLPAGFPFPPAEAFSASDSMQRNTQADEATLRALVEKLYADYARKDVDAYFSSWSPHSPSLDKTREALRQLFVSANESEIRKIAFAQIKIEGDKAHVRADIDLEYTKTGGTVAEPRTLYRALECIFDAGAWKIWDDVAAEELLAASLAEAMTADERSRLLTANTRLLTAELRDSLITQGVMRYGRGQIEQARTIFELTREISEKTGDRLGIAKALNGMGLTFLARFDYARALENLQQSLALRDAGDDWGIGSALGNIGLIFQAQGDFDTARDFDKRAMPHREATGDRSFVAAGLNNLGVDYFELGDFRMSLECYHKSLDLGGSGAREGAANTMNNIGNVYRHQGDYDLALSYYRRAVDEFTALKNQPRISVALNNLGTAYFSLERYPEALETFDKSLALRDPKDTEGVSNILNNIGDVYKTQGEYERALENYQRCLEMRRKVSGQALISEALSNIAEVYHALGRNGQALAPAEEAVQSARKANNPDIFWAVCTTAGHVYRAAGRPAEARAVLEDAIQAIEGMRGNIAGNAQTQERFFEDKVEAYHQMVGLLVAQAKVEEGLAYAERAKSRALLDVLASARVNISKAMTAAEQEQEKQIQRELAVLNLQVLRANPKEPADQQRLISLREELSHTQMKLEDFQTKLYAIHPELQIQRGRIPAFNIRRLAALLPDERTALLEYTVTKKQTFLFVLTRNESNTPQVKVYTIDAGRNDLNKRAEDFRRQLANHELGFLPTAKRLYNELFKPAAQQLKGRSRLVIVPDAGLWELPFRALAQEDGHFLIENFAISSAPSLTALSEMMSLRRTRQGMDSGTTLLAFGNPSFGLVRGGSGESGREGSVFEALPNTENEVRELARIYGPQHSRIYLGSDATEERLKNEIGNASVVHLATHGILNNASPMYSHIVLAQPEEKGPEDGLLESWEVMKLNLRADLVVLSACETGRGRIGPGEGVIGLTWAFFVAGAPTTVVSQWKVDSASTAELMQEFHRRLLFPLHADSAATSKAEALREAELKLLKNPKYRHPFYWASFNIIGDAM